MLGRWLQSKTARVALWTSALTLGFYDVVLAQHWWRGGLYILGAAMCVTMNHAFKQKVSVVEVAASLEGYKLGRDHNTRTEQSAQVFSIGRRP